MRHLLPATLATLVALATPLAAGDHPVVVELFTSQGCSSCPPADKLLHDLAAREDVIALALHVDYWDYIGWKDPFGSPAHAERQRGYAKAGGRRSVFTPEMVVMGQTDIVGARPMELGEAIAEHAEIAPTVELELARMGDSVSISARPLSGPARPATVHMLRYTPLRTTVIERGENKGETFDYANVVEDWQVIGKWDGAAPLELTAEAPGDRPVVVLVQAGGVGPILAAARID
jgi:hypothetical protein